MTPPATERATPAVSRAGGHGAPHRILIEQTYPGHDDHERHFACLLKAFLDPRYIRVDGKPLLLIFAPRDLPEPAKLLNFWRRKAREAGLPGLFVLAIGHVRWNDILTTLGYDGTVTMKVPPARIRFAEPTVYDHDDIVDELVHTRTPGTVDFPCVSPNWDNTPPHREKWRGPQQFDAGLVLPKPDDGASFAQTNPTTAN